MRKILFSRPAQKPTATVQQIDNKSTISPQQIERRVEVGLYTFHEFIVMSAVSIVHLYNCIISACVFVCLHRLHFASISSILCCMHCPNIYFFCFFSILLNIKFLELVFSLRIAEIPRSCFSFRITVINCLYVPSLSKTSKFLV